MLANESGGGTGCGSENAGPEWRLIVELGVVDAHHEAVDRGDIIAGLVLSSLGVLSVWK